MATEQRNTKVTYGGHEYSVPVSEGEKVIAAMTAAAPVAVEMVHSPERSTWIVVGGGIPVAVYTDERPAPVRRVRVL